MAIVITKQPTNVAANVNDTVSITLEATGDGLVYDWQYSTNATKFYSLSASASASNWTYDQPTLTFKGYSSYFKYYFRCKITDANGDSVFSNIVRAINLAEAGAGFILPDTLHSLAEAIRAKTETSGAILPADMAAMIAALSSGGFEVVNGSFETATTGQDTTVNLGATLPASDNYVFFVRIAEIHGVTSENYRPVCGLIMCQDGVITRRSLWSAVSKAKSYIFLDTYDYEINGDTLSMTGGSYGSNVEYEWWYLYE